jgi:hypothetical protein
MSKRKIKVVPLEQTIEAPQVESIVDPAPKEDINPVEDSTTSRRYATC